MKTHRADRKVENGMPEQPIDKLLRLEEVLAQVSVGRSKLYDMIQLEEFPEPVKIGRGSRWSQIEVQGWIQEQKNRRAA